MATLFRATVMLVVLVGLPAAWVYYGPLPPTAMGVIQRTVATAKHSLGWGEPLPSVQQASAPPKTAPRYDAAIASAAQTLRQLPAEAQAPPPAMVRDSQFLLASANLPVEPQASPLEVDAELASLLEPHLSLLRKLDATEYTLENWGDGGRFYRFRCAIALGGSEELTRQFEAVHTDPLRAVHQVVGEVTSWQNARHSVGTRWQ